VLERVGLVLKSDKGGGYYDRFRGRLLFSIRDARSRPIAFGGRILPGATQSNPERTEAKYINSPETPLFSKSSELYALDLARDAITKEQGLVVMEGYTDVIMAHQHGINNAVAVLGTALGEKHIPLVRRFTDSVTLVLDGDEAGQNRTMQILDELLALFVAHEIDLRILTLPTGADPCDVISSQGSEAFRERLTESLDALDHKIFAVTNGLESAPGTHRTALAVEEIIGLTAVRREQSSRAPRRATIQSTTPTTQKISLLPWERELLELVVHEPALLPQLADQISVDEIPHDICRAVYAQAVELMHAGQIPTFDQLMLATNDPEVKNLLVDCDETGREKKASDIQLRMSDLLALLEQKKQSARHQSAMSEFSQKRLDPGNEDQALDAMFQDLKRKEAAKRRQAGSAPTDG